MDLNRQSMSGLPVILQNHLAVRELYPGSFPESLKRSLHEASSPLKRRKLVADCEGMGMNSDRNESTVQKLLRMNQRPFEARGSGKLTADPQFKQASACMQATLQSIQASNIQSRLSQIDNLYKTRVAGGRLGSSLLGGPIGRNSSASPTIVDESLSIARLGSLRTTALQAGSMLPSISARSLPSSSAATARPMQAPSVLHREFLLRNESALRLAEARLLCSIGQFGGPTQVKVPIQQQHIDRRLEAEPFGRRPKGRFVNLYIQSDEGCLSQFQCLSRKQIELFEATQDDVEAGARGRNTAIVAGQVGIRCKHCAHVTPLSKKRAAVYFPTKFERVYQTAVNMATIHLCQHCEHVPPYIRQELLRLQAQKANSGGGKRYVASGVSQLGVMETEDGLKFAPSQESSPQKKPSAEATVTTGV